MHRLAAVVSVTLCLGAPLWGLQDPTHAGAAAMEKKLAAIAARGAQPATPSAAPLRTSLVEQEVNAFFQVDGPLFMPEGVGDARVTIGDAGQVSARATVDIDTVKKANPKSLFLKILSGKVDVTAAGTLHAANGMGTFALESATVGSVPVPKSLLQLIVSSYSATPESPNGLDLDKPFPLPANIRSVETVRGTATIVQ